MKFNEISVSNGKETATDGRSSSVPVGTVKDGKEYETRIERRNK